MNPVDTTNVTGNDPGDITRPRSHYMARRRIVTERTADFLIRTGVVDEHVRSWRIDPITTIAHLDPHCLPTETPTTTLVGDVRTIASKQVLCACWHQQLLDETSIHVLNLEDDPVDENNPEEIRARRELYLHELLHRIDNLEKIEQILRTGLNATVGSPWAQQWPNLAKGSLLLIERRTRAANESLEATPDVLEPAVKTILHLAETLRHLGADYDPDQALIEALDWAEPAGRSPRRRPRTVFYWTRTVSFRRELPEPTELILELGQRVAGRTFPYGELPETIVERLNATPDLELVKLTVPHQELDPSTWEAAKTLLRESTGPLQDPDEALKAAILLA